MNQTKAEARVVPDDEIDLREVFLKLWRLRWLIVLVTFVSLSISAIYAFLIAKPSFESSALLLPIQPPNVDQLGAAAALLGKKATGNGDVDLYQSLLTSRTVIQKLLREGMSNKSDTGKGVIEPLYKILQIDTANQIQMSNIVNGLSKSISVGSKESGTGGILEVKISAGTPWLAQEIGNSVLEIGQEELRIVRINRSDVILSRLSFAVAQSKAEWDSAARKVAWYKERNRSIQLPEQFLTVSRLDLERSAKEQKYLLVRREYDLQQLERAKATPPMMVLDAANLPVRKSKPKRALILMLGMFLGATISSLGILSWHALTSKVTYKT